MSKWPQLLFRFLADERRSLMPLIQKAKNAGEDGKVMSVLGAGYGGAIDLNDLGLKKKYSVTAAGLQGPSYNDCMIEVSNSTFIRTTSSL
jgi:hypothetical protein